MNDPRARLGHQLSGLEPQPVLEALDRLRPVLRLGRGLGAIDASAAVALGALLVRMHPHLELDGDATLGVNPWGVTTVAEGVELFRRIAPTPTTPPATDFVLAIGASISGADRWVGGTEWTAHLADAPVDASSVNVGIGIHVSAALATALMFKVALAPVGLVSPPPAGEIVWNAVDYRRRPAPDVVLGRPSLPLLAVLGGGSLGSSAAGVLGCHPIDDGESFFVDGDDFDPVKNTFRYPAASGSQQGPKAEWIASMLQGAGWRCEPFVDSVKKWVASRPAPGFYGIAVSSVDTVDGRFQVADVLARTTLSIGVDALTLHVQREHLGDGMRCPFCDYVNERSPLSQAGVFAQLTGLEEARIARLLVEGETLTDADVTTVCRARGLDPEWTSPLVGRRLQDLLDRVYAEAAFPAGSSGELVAVSAPFVSWIGGVLAAGEVLKAGYGLPLVDRRVEIDLLGEPPDFVHRRHADGTGRCPCASWVRRRWMNRSTPSDEHIPPLPSVTEHNGRDDALETRRRGPALPHRRSWPSAPKAAPRATT